MLVVGIFSKIKINTMNETHVYNETLGRLEPKVQVCRFCNTNDMNDIEDCYFAPIYRVKDRTILIVYNSVKFAKLLIGIPRCQKCSKIHNESEGYALVFSLVSSIIFLIISAYIGGIGIFVGVIGSLAIGFFGFDYLKDYLPTKKGIPSMKEMAKKDLTVQYLTQNGWTLEKPSA